MRLRFTGTAGGGGWPAPGCACASCNRAGAAPRRPLHAVLDEEIGLGPAGPTGDLPDGYDAAPVRFGTVVQGPDGGRLLWPGPPGADLSGADRSGGDASAHADDRSRPCAPVHAAVVDTARPAAFGALRRCGLLPAGAPALAVGGDHSVHSRAEFDRRAALWDAIPVHDGQELQVSGTAPPAPRPLRPHRVLVTGGARSGKSAEAERRLLGEPDVVYIATGPSPGGDGDWARRVGAHRARRPPWWATEETADAAAALDRAAASGAAVLLDCAGTWLTAVMGDCGLWEDAPPADAEAAVERRVSALFTAWRRFPGHLVAVTNEVGSGVVPATRSGGLFRDLLGRLNQRLAAESETVLSATAGRIVELP